MPSPGDHKAQAISNEQVAQTLASTAPDWAVTVFFYAALHWVRAYLALKNLQPSSHGQTFDELRKDASLPVDFLDRYRRLYRLSREARYECPNQLSMFASVPTARNLLNDLKQVISPRIP